MTTHAMEVVRVGIDTYRHPIAYLRADCPVCRSEGFEALARVEISADGRRIEAALNVVSNGLLQPGHVGLSDVAFRSLGVPEHTLVDVRHPRPLESFSSVRSKIYGHRLLHREIDAIVADIAAGRYPEVHIASFLTACAGDHLDLAEIIGLTDAMVRIGSRLDWGRERVVDKHCVGGLPGNRTTPIVVAIVAAHGLLIPKTSSRAITSPAGTADVVDTFTRSALSVEEMRRVVEQQGGCLAWGGAMGLSPVDDVLVRVEHPLDLDSEGQLVASVLSKKIAAGSTHVVLDLPVGPTAKVRTEAAAERLEALLEAVGHALGLHVACMRSDGSQPVGRGVGPALEGRDVIAVLRRDPDAPRDLRERALTVAGRVIELDPAVPPGTGEGIARSLLDGGQAWTRFLGICEAQGGFREPAVAAYTAPVLAARSGRVGSIDNRRLSRVARLAGAPGAAVAGLVLHCHVGERVIGGQPLYTLHSAAEGELDYAYAYVQSHPAVVTIDEDRG